MERKPRKKIVFDPQVAYEWQPDDVFQLTGLEIDKMQKALSAAASSSDFQKHALIYEGLVAFNNFFKTAVEEGSIKPKPNDMVKASTQSEIPYEKESYDGEVEATVSTD